MSHAPVTPSPPPTVEPTPSAPSEAIYKGAFEDGGEVEFTVSPDGTTITAFAAEYINCDGNGTSDLNNSNGTVPYLVEIDGGRFEFGDEYLDPPRWGVTGELLANGMAEGTLWEAAAEIITDVDACKVDRSRSWQATLSE